MSNQNQFLKPYKPYLRKPLIILSILSIIMSLTAILFAYFSKDAIDSAILVLDKFYLYALILICILLVQLISQAINSYYKAYVTNHLYKRIQADYFSKLLYAVPDHMMKHSSDHIHLFKKDLQLISEGLVDLLPKFIFYIFRFLGAFIVLYILNPLFAILFLGIGLFLLMISRLLRKPISNSHKKAVEAESSMYTYMQDSLSHLEVIKAYQVENETLNRLDDLNQNLIKRNLYKQKISILSNTGLQTFFSFGYAFSIIFGAYQLSQGDITVGALTAIIQLVSNIQSPFSGLSHLIPKYFQMQASIDRIDLLNLLDQEVRPSTNLETFETIDLVDVSFKYAQKPVITNLNLTFNKNNHYHLMGKSGLGKTTLLKLLLGLLKPDEGRLHLNGKDTIELSPSTRAYFAYVPQTPFIFYDTIYHNLTLYKDKTKDDVIKACKQAQIYDEIVSLENGFDTTLGEGGKGLSIGQLQRLSLARALLRNSPVLILDEINASLDLHTESLLLKTIETLKDKTIILISHKDLSAYHFHTIDLENLI